jgi:hypothetical protein
MNFSKEVSKLVTNKYFLYFIVFLAVTNVLGYLVTNKFNAVIFFALVGLLTYQFSKNMAIVLLVAIIATNFLISSRIIKEGLENANSDALNKVASTDPDLAKALPIVKKSKTVDEAKAKMSSDDNVVITDTDNTDETSDINNPELNKPVTEAGAPEGFGEKLSNNKKNHNSKGSRLDYAATIEQSYKNLDDILGAGSIQQLTKDTQNLMAKQTELFDTMNKMVPVLEGAQNMLKNFDMSSISDTLKGMTHLGSK